MTAKEFLNKQGIHESRVSALNTSHAFDVCAAMMEQYRDHCRDEWVKEINQIAMVQASYSDDEMDREKYLHGEYVASLCANVLSDE